MRAGPHPWRAAAPLNAGHESVTTFSRGRKLPVYGRGGRPLQCVPGDSDQMWRMTNAAGAIVTRSRHTAWGERRRVSLFTRLSTLFDQSLRHDWAQRADRLRLNRELKSTCLNQLDAVVARHQHHHIAAGNRDSEHRCWWRRRLDSATARQAFDRRKADHALAHGRTPSDRDTLFSLLVSPQSSTLLGELVIAV
jgi:hypothetical protein